MIGLEDNIDFFINEFGEDIEHSGIIKTAIIKDAVENINFYNDKLIISTFPISTGNIVKYKNNTYFINSEIDKNENTFKGRLKKSNYIVKFMINNEINEYPVLLETSAQGANSNKYFSVPVGQAQVMFEDTEELRKLVMVYNTRFIASKTSYKITSYDLSINGFITIMGEKDTVAIDDDLTNEVPNRWSNGNSRYIITSINETESLSKGGILKISPQVLDREKNIIIASTFNYSSNNTAIATVNSLGEISAVASGESIIKITGSSAVGYLVVGVDVMPVSIDNHIINISGSSTIVLNGQQTYTVSVTNNLPVTWTLKNVHSGGTAGGTIVSQTSSSCAVKRTTTGAFKLIATIKDTNKLEEMIIN